MTAVVMPRVLYVEDEPIVRRIVTHAIERGGMEIRTAVNGSDGVAVAKQWQPDVVLMDLMMPVMDGFEAARALRSEESTRHIPILAFSASPPNEVEARVSESGINGFLPKTTPHARLIDAIRRCVRAEF